MAVSRHSWLLSTGSSIAGAVLLMSESGSQCCWLVESLRADVGLLVGGAMAQGLLRLVPAHWCFRLVLALVSVHWWVEQCFWLQVPECVIICVYPLRVESLFPTTFCLSKIRPSDLNAKHSGGLSFWCRNPSLGRLTVV